MIYLVLFFQLGYAVANKLVVNTSVNKSCLRKEVYYIILHIAIFGQLTVEMLCRIMFDSIPFNLFSIKDLALKIKQIYTVHNYKPDISILHSYYNHFYLAVIPC